MRLPWESVPIKERRDEAGISLHEGQTHPLESTFTLWECTPLAEVTGSCLKCLSWRDRKNL